MTYRQLCAILQDAKMEDAEWDALCLMEHFCAVSHSLLRAAPDRNYENAALENAISRRLAHEPLQYILGEWEFYRQTYEVSPDCLIPRADTEVLVETAIRLLPIGARFADLCTGSGCIAISIADLRADLRGVAVELYPKTLEIAKRNAKRNNVLDKILFSQGDVLLGDALLDERFSAIISNPPYIRTDVIDTLSIEVKHEPRAALDGGEDGLVFYRAITDRAKAVLKPNGFILYEVGIGQADDVAAIGEKNGFSAEIYPDLSGIPRAVLLRKL